jgi:hypothetical protein
MNLGLHYDSLPSPLLLAFLQFLYFYIHKSSIFQLHQSRFSRNEYTRNNRKTVGCRVFYAVHVISYSLYGETKVGARVDAGSNTSTAARRVVGGDEKGPPCPGGGGITAPPCSGGYKYGDQAPSGLRKSRIWDSKICLRVPRDSDPRMPAPARACSNCKRQRQRLTRTNPQLADSNKNLVVSPRSVLDVKTEWLTDRRL